MSPSGEGNRRQQTFFGEEDYQHHLDLVAQFRGPLGQTESLVYSP